MIIKADKEAQELIIQLLDLALKQGGVKNLEAVNAIAKCLVEIPKEKESVKKENKNE